MPDNDRGRPGEEAPHRSNGDEPRVSAASDTAVQATLTEAGAARLVTRINLRLTTVADNREQVVPLIEQAKAGNAHTVLGYRSWPEFVADKFGGVLARLMKSERLPFVEMLADQGMSTRAIASVVGVSKDTVSRDLRAGVSPDTPDQAAGEPRLRPDEIDGLISSGMVENLDDLQEFDQALRDVLSREVVAKKTIGIDGKTYTRSTPAAPRRQNRRPLPDAYRDASDKVLKAAGSLSRLHQDDRFSSNREAVVRRSAADLARAANELLDLLDDLGVDRHQYGGVR